MLTNSNCYRGEKSEDLKNKADLITSFTHAWTPKSPSIDCYDFLTGELVVIPLPMGKNPSDYAMSLYKKSRKLKRSVKVLENFITKVSLSTRLT
jgi:predicted ribosome quality control (RQC) complex YloA/Tae2 family protein